MQNETSQRFESFWTQFGSSVFNRRLAIVGSENPQNFICLRNKHLCHFISNSKDCLREAKNLGFIVYTSLRQDYDLVIIEVTRSRDTNLGLVSLADYHIKIGGGLIINGDNQLGVKSFLKKVSQYWPDEKIIVKKKGRIALYIKKKKFAHWKKYLNYEINKDGYYTRSDMFSPKEIDKGSKKLTSFFKSNLCGEVADLGAGWGYLSKEALSQNTDITKLTLFENNYSAYLASKKNINDPRASFKWASLEDLKDLGPRFNHIICNPPFHIGNAKNLELLKSFVFHSSRLITQKGIVWMVFVSGVYFENDLKKCFNYVKSLYKDKNYCVYQLLKPKKLKV